MFSITLLFAIFVASKSQEELVITLRKEYCVDNGSLRVYGYDEDGPQRFRLFIKDKNKNKYELYGLPNKMPDHHYPRYYHVRESNFVETDVSKNSSVYRFVDKYNIYLVKTEDQWRLQSFNQIWLGCPQPLCLDAKIDAASLDKTTGDYEVYLFRANYMWRFSEHRKTPASSNAKAINVDNKWFFDCALMRNKKMQLFKGSDKYMESGNQWSFSHFDGPGEPDAAIAMLDYDVYFKGDKVYWKKYDVAGVLQEANLPVELRDGDAAISYIDSRVVLFKGWKHVYTRIIIKIVDGKETVDFDTTSIEWRSTVSKYFTCDYSHTMFGNYDTYKESIENFYGPVAWIDVNERTVPTSAETIAVTTTATDVTLLLVEPDENRTFIIVVILIIAGGVVMCSFAYFTMRQKEARQKKIEARTTSDAKGKKTSASLSGLKSETQSKLSASVIKDQPSPKLADSSLAAVARPSRLLSRPPSKGTSSVIKDQASPKKESKLIGNKKKSRLGAPLSVTRDSRSARSRQSTRSGRSGKGDVNRSGSIFSAARSDVGSSKTSIGQVPSKASFLSVAPKQSKS